MKTAKERYEYFFKNILTPFLKEKGFKRKSNRFTAYGKELAYSFHVCRSKINTADYTGFVIYADIFLHNFEEKNNPTIYKRELLAAAVARLDKNYKMINIILQTEDEDAELKDAENAAYFLKAIEESAIPFMERFKTVRDVIHFLENLKPEENFLNIPASENIIPNQLAELYWLLGEKDKALQILDHKIATAKTRLVREGGEELKSRILKGGPVYTQP
ncbi:MAG: DUF4304 domain-containing protein [Alphaproteobacteria bacterium]